MDYQLLLAPDLGADRHRALSAQAEEVRRVRIGYLKRLRRP